MVVVVLGVLVALAADRWNQTRIDRAVQDAYLARFVEEIRADSLRAAAYVRDQPGMVASLDTLQSFLGGGPQPPNLVATALAVSSELVILEPVTWTEIQASNSLALIEDIETRSALTAYYRDRERRVLQWTRQDSRARDPFWGALYLTGIFDPRDEARAGSLADVERFKSWPGMSDLLLAVGSGHYFQRFIADLLMEEAGRVLRVLESEASA